MMLLFEMLVVSAMATMGKSVVVLCSSLDYLCSVLFFFYRSKLTCSFNTWLSTARTKVSMYSCE
jgi:hypothetical protein